MNLTKVISIIRYSFLMIWLETTYVKFRYDEELSATVFDPRFLCNLESAIRYHPNNTVCILIYLPPQSPAIKSLSNLVYQLYEKIKSAKVWRIVIWYNIFWLNSIDYKPCLVWYHTIFFLNSIHGQVIH